MFKMNGLGRWDHSQDLAYLSGPANCGYPSTGHSVADCKDCFVALRDRLVVEIVQFVASSSPAAAAWLDVVASPVAAAA